MPAQNAKIMPSAVLPAARKSRSSRASGSGIQNYYKPVPSTNGQWQEPPLADSAPSYVDHGGQPMGVLEDMQALGQPPSTKVKARVKPDSMRKSLAKSVGAVVGSEDVRDSTPAHPSPSPDIADQTLTVDSLSTVTNENKDSDYRPKAPVKTSSQPRQTGTRRSENKRQSSRRSTAARSSPATAQATDPQSTRPHAPHQSASDLTKSMISADNAAKAANDAAGPRAATATDTDSNSAQQNHHEVITIEDDSQSNASSRKKRKRELDPATLGPRLFMKDFEGPSPEFEEASGAYNLRGIVLDAIKRCMNEKKSNLGHALEQLYCECLTRPELQQLLRVAITRQGTPVQTRAFHDEVSRAKEIVKLYKKAEKRGTPADEAGAAATPAPSLPAQSVMKPEQPTSSPRTRRSTAQPKQVSPAPASTSASVKVRQRTSTPTPTPSDRRATRRSAAKSVAEGVPVKMAAAIKDEEPLQKAHTSPSQLPATDDTIMDEADHVMSSPTRQVRSVSVSSSRSSKDEPTAIRVKGSAATSHDDLPPRPLQTTNGVKRSSADADLALDERERTMMAKKIKLAGTVARDPPPQDRGCESSIRTTPARRSQRATRGVGGDGSAISDETLAEELRESSGSPLSELSTPRGSPSPIKALAKLGTHKARIKQSPKKTSLPPFDTKRGVDTRASSPLSSADDSDNNDFCNSCGGGGYLLCCDGCDKSFHFTCLDPPLDANSSQLNEPWFCHVCVAKRSAPQRHARGLFSALLTNLDKRNPTVFTLPNQVKNYFEGVHAAKDGSFSDVVNVKTRNRAGYDEPLDLLKTKDAKGGTILCYSCGKSAAGKREMITCDTCSSHWHLDCTDPPLAIAPIRDQFNRKGREWLCPLHVDHELRQMDPGRLSMRRKIHMRRPKNAVVRDTLLNRGAVNNGMIDIVDESSSGEDSELDEGVFHKGVVLRLPSKGIKLDFIDKVNTTVGRCPPLSPVPWSSAGTTRTAAAAATSGGEADAALSLMLMAEKHDRDGEMQALAQQNVQLATENSRLQRLLSELQSRAQLADQAVTKHATLEPDSDHPTDTGVSALKDSRPHAIDKGPRRLDARKRRREVEGRSPRRNQD